MSKFTSKRKNLYFELLQSWCDSLVDLQIEEIKSSGIYGGIMCPVCSRIHGRSADAVYPLMYLAEETGEDKYLTTAKKLQSWSEHMSCPDGSWVNDTDRLWKGITVFGTIALGEALRHHGNILDDKTYNKWKDRVARAAEYLYKNIEMDTGNINYPVTCSAAMAISGKLLAENRFLNRAEELAHNSLDYFTDNNILFGEGKPQTGISAKNCRPVDLGYNVEESLPGLTIYGLIMNDKEVLNQVKKSLASHLEFMLPDGAWDNSWGNRNYKWTYWGSRTSDGCQIAYELMAEENPVFAEAAWRNLKLFERCTNKGKLHGGLHHHQRGELPCIHHTFCHAKTLAGVLDYKTFNKNKEDKDKIVLPREKEYGIKEFEEINTRLVSRGKWRATVTDYDWEYVAGGHASGGALSLLYHQEIGPVLSASMIEYQMVEPHNMQRQRDEIDMSLTPHLEYEEDGIVYRSDNDYGAEVESREKNGYISIYVEGKLVDKKQATSSSGTIEFDME
ncbi:MAG: hypothetical protein ACOCRB_01430, partial [Halanaerobiaceae bacterium]